MAKFLKKLLLTLAVVIVGLVIAVAIVWAPELRTMRTVHSVGGNRYLWQVDYRAPYDLDDVVASNLDSNEAVLTYIVGRITRGLVDPARLFAAKDTAAADGDHCTSFLAPDADGDGYLFGRNYDYFKNPSLVTVSHPRQGYASIACSDMSHFGYSLDKVPDTFLGRLLCLAAIYAPVDGMNERGLCTSIMALPKQPAQQDNGRPHVGTTILMRLWLDRCATVDEALALLDSVDVRHDVKAGSGYHYMVADATGDCAVVEFDPENGWKTLITRKPADAAYLHVTNHLLAPGYYTTEPDPRYGNPHSRSWYRYATVQQYLDSLGGTITHRQAQECLARVHWKDFVWDDGVTVEDTQFSNVYDPAAQTLTLRHWADYDAPQTFTLEPAR